MTNTTFCIYQNDYNYTVLGDKMYHLTDSAFLFWKRCYLSNNTFFHFTHNLFLYKNVDLVLIYVTFLHTDITSFHGDGIFLQRYVATLHTCHILTLQMSHYNIQMSHFYITKSHLYRQNKRFQHIIYVTLWHTYVVFLHRDIAFLNRELSHSYIVISYHLA